MRIQQIKREHCHNIAFTRQLVQQAIEKLKGSLGADGTLNETHFWGERETFLSALVKLTQIQMKLIPLEQELQQNKTRKPPSQKAHAEGQHFSAEDWRLLAAAIERRSASENE